MNRGTTKKTRIANIVIVLATALLLATVEHRLVQAADTGGSEVNVILHVVTREALFFSAQSGTWTSVRLEAGERVLQRGTGDNVALIVTDLRAVAFSSYLSVAAEVLIRAGSEDTVEAVKAAGNTASVLTRRHAYGFSAITGRWAVQERFQPR